MGVTGSGAGRCLKVLVVGNGAREHAIAWKLRQSPSLGELYVAPGNAGTAGVANNVSLEPSDIAGLLRFASAEHVDLTVVGPEAPLAAGIVDRFSDAGLLVFGPTQAAARIETSKSFAKDLMVRHGIPTAMASVFDDYAAARAYVESAPEPLVVKADGLAAGKGVVVAESRQAALDAVQRQMVERQFGEAGGRVLIEEYLEGEELTVLALVAGESVSSFMVARDYKRAGDGDTGPNTGGIGAFSPLPPSLWDGELESRVRSEIVEPVAKALAEEGCEYRGVLYAGLMLTDDGPKVIEFNCRLGDPEAQVVLPRLKSDLLEAMIATAEGRMEGLRLDLDERACVGVVVASGGYPDRYQTGYPIEGLDGFSEDTVAFHAGTAVANGQVEPVTSGGRVLTVAALAGTVEQARLAAYTNVERVSFKDAYYRTDIAAPS